MAAFPFPSSIITIPFVSAVTHDFSAEGRLEPWHRAPKEDLSFRQCRVESIDPRSVEPSRPRCRKYAPARYGLLSGAMRVAPPPTGQSRRYLVSQSRRFVAARSSSPKVMVADSSVDAIADERGTYVLVANNPVLSTVIAAYRRGILPSRWYGKLFNYAPSWLWRGNDVRIRT